MIHHKISKHKLDNGLNFFYCHTPNDVSFEISMHIDTGSRDENLNNNGVSHFLEHMMFRGSKCYPNSILLARAMEKFGGEINAYTGYETTNYWMKGDSEATIDAIESFSDFFLNPNFADLEIERKVILQELASDYNDRGTCIDVEYLAMNALFRDHPIGYPIIGIEKTIKNISILDLNEKREQFYFPSNCALTIYSHLPENSVLDALNKHFVKKWKTDGSLPIIRKNPLDSMNYNRKITKRKRHYDCFALQNNLDNQFNLKILFPTVNGASSDTIAVSFLQRVLDDGICTRLPASIRERYGLVYDISCDSQFFKEVGTFSIDATVSEDLFIQLLDKLSLELKGIILDSPLKEEIEHVKYRYLFDLKQIENSPSRLLNREVNSFFSGFPLNISDEMEIVKNLNEEKIHSIAKQIFGAEFRAFALVGPRARKKRKLLEQFFQGLNYNG